MSQRIRMSPLKITRMRTQCNNAWAAMTIYPDMPKDYASNPHPANRLLPTGHLIAVYGSPVFRLAGGFHGRALF